MAYIIIFQIIGIGLIILDNAHITKLQYPKLHGLETAIISCELGTITVINCFTP